MAPRKSAASAPAASAPASSATTAPASDDMIRLRGARVHNLKNVDVDIPRDRLVVLTGPSGSGKSSLAFDTLYAEGQRQYLETLSIYARQFLHSLERPDIDSLDGLPPTICIDQRVGARNPRSTVATATEIHDFLRLLYARLGEPECHQCGQPIRQQSPEQIQQRLVRLPEGTRLMLLAPMVRGRKGEHQAVFETIRKAGFVRVRIDGQLCDVERLPPLDPRKNHTIEAVVDRIIVKPDAEPRLAESLRLAIKHGEGVLIACHQQGRAASLPSSAGREPPADDTWRDELFSTRYACAACEISYDELEPRTFSFNSPYGACPTCEGLGLREQFDPELLFPEPARSLDRGALAPYRDEKRLPKRIADAAAAFLAANRLDRATPLERWPTGAVSRWLNGPDGNLAEALEKELATATDDERRERLESFRGQVVCAACHGSRLRPEANRVRVGGRTIGEFSRLSIGEARQACDELRFSDDDQRIAEPMLNAIRGRLDFLIHVGVPYLTLGRATDSLSGGELQRVRLAASIGSGLVGVCYILDEPSIGLHPRDNQRLIDSLRDLQRQGNTVLVVEHDEAVMRQADWLIDMGPGAGRLGGEVVGHGTLADVCAQPSSPTGRYLSGTLRIADLARRRPMSRERAIVLRGATLHNLRSLDVHFPLGGLVCVTGVSGSGKSSLVNETLVPALRRKLGADVAKPGPFQTLGGVEAIDKVIPVDQTPLGRTPRGNAATYTGVFDDIRKLYAATREAKQRGFSASRFSFNAKGGRCEECQGHGLRKIEMNFLPDLYVDCGECGGKRFNRPTLEIKYRDLSIADVLELSVDAAVEFFANVSSIHKPLAALRDVGLGYLPLGQPSNTLSGGEAQRVKLAAELCRTETGRTLYILDEPTTGLHFEDIRRLLNVLNQLVDKGNTAIVIEHNLDVIACADWIIDLGPEGGAGGGQLLAEGPPAEIARRSGNATGEFLAHYQAGRCES
jgi:excinuclease ABC subunit A